MAYNGIARLNHPTLALFLDLRSRSAKVMLAIINCSMLTHCLKSITGEHTKARSHGIVLSTLRVPSKVVVDKDDRVAVQL